MQKDCIMNTKHKKRYLVWLGLVMVLLAIAVWPSNYFIESPGRAFPVSSFVKTKRPKSKNLYLVTVSESRQPVSVAHYLLSFTQKYDSRVPSAELLAGQTSSQYEELQNWYMQTSEQNAIYYAAKKAHLKPELKYLGVYVMQIQKNSSFKHKLQIGDTVLGANGHRFQSAKEMMTYLNKQKLGQKVTIQVSRENKRHRFRGKIIKLAHTKRKGIGIMLVEHLKVKTKPALRINAGEIGGPSAGLMFTLESYEIFNHLHLAKKHKIAGTGTIDATGKVGIIGGVDKKVVAADREHAAVFFAPTDRTGVKKSETNYEVAKRTAKEIHTKMKIVPVARFEDALRYLEKHDH